MKRKVIKDENIGGIYTVVETLEKSKEDGLVHERDTHEVGTDKIGKYHYGTSKHFIMTTNNPNITRPFTYGVSAIFFIIGVIMSIFEIYATRIPLVGIVFIIFGIYCFIHCKKEIDEVEEEIRQQGGNVIESSALEDWKELGEDVKEGLEDASKSTFTKENFKWFNKLCIIIMSIIIPIISVIVGLILGIKLGILVFVISVFGTILYLFVLSKICKY